MAEANGDLFFGEDHVGPPSRVSLAPFSPIPSLSHRRLSSHFVKPSSPVLSARRLVWVSLQGRVVNAEECSSALAIGGGLSREEAVAWELFTPIQRTLILALIGVSACKSRTNRLIWQLKKSVELRDQVLSNMQQKLDNLCEQLNNVKDQPGTGAKNVESPSREDFGSDGIKFVDCGCWLCDKHVEKFTGLVGNSVAKTSSDDQMLQYKMNLVNEAEPEERRMSDLSDWAFSVTSAAEIQFNNLAIEQDIFNMKKECEEKDAIIKELSSFVQSSKAAGSKRLSELEDIIRRKNMIITRLKKDMVVLEQKLVQLTRLNRPSSSSSSSNSWRLPVMTDNVLYDMDSSTSPSSSDSDSSPKNRPQNPIPNVQEAPVQNGDLDSTRDQRSTTPAKASSPSARHRDHGSKSRSVSPLREIAMNEKYTTLSSRQRQSSASGDTKRSGRRIQSASKDATPKKRWV